MSNNKNENQKEKETFDLQQLLDALKPTKTTK